MSLGRLRVWALSASSGVETRYYPGGPNSGSWAGACPLRWSPLAKGPSGPRRPRIQSALSTVLPKLRVARAAEAAFRTRDTSRGTYHPVTDSSHVSHENQLHSPPTPLPCLVTISDGPVYSRTVKAFQRSKTHGRSQVSTRAPFQYQSRQTHEMTTGKTSGCPFLSSLYRHLPFPPFLPFWAIPGPKSPPPHTKEKLSDEEKK